MKSIRAKLIVLLLCCVIISSVVVGLICALQTSSILQESSEQNTLLLCEKSAREVNTGLNNIRNSVDTLAHFITENLPSATMLTTGESAELADYFAKITQVGINHASSLPGAVAVYAVFDPAVYGNTGFFYHTNESDKLTAYPLPTLPTPGKAETDWWNSPLKPGNPTWINKGLKKRA